MLLIIYNTQTNDLQTFSKLPDLPNSPKQYNKLNKEIDAILIKFGLELSDTEKFKLYRGYSNILIGQEENQIDKVEYQDKLKEEIISLISKADLNAISINSTSIVIQSFITHYLYDQIQEIMNNGLNNEECLIEVDFNELEYYLKLDEYDYFLHNRFNELKNIFEKTLIKEFDITKAQIILTNMPKNTALNFIGSKYLGKTVSFEGTITKLSEKFAIIKEAMFECQGCLRQSRVKQETPFLTTPGMCPDCGGRKFRLISDESEYRDAYMMELEEIPELRKGNRAERIVGKVEGLIVDPNNPLNLGDTLTVTGVVNVRHNEKTKRNEFNLDINNYINNKTSYKDIEITPEDVKEIEKLSKEPDILNKLRNSLIPFIHGHDEVKRGLIIQLFSGELETKPKMRTGINILLIGDPGVAKSKMGKHIVELTPRAKYVEGTGVTKAGLVGDVSRDNVFGEGWTYSIGTILQANQGLLVIDEIDKTPRDIIVSINECTSQGSVTINKAGQRDSFDTNTNVLAMGNPKYSSFDNYKNLWEQCRIIDDTTLSRFHLIYAMPDTISKEKDQSVMMSILTGDEDKEAEISDELLNKYIAYAKTNFSPRFDKKALKLLTDYFYKIREESSQSEDGKPLTNRDGESLRNITMAIARIRLSDTATAEDAELAIEIYNEALKTVDLTINTAGAIHGVKSKIDKEKEEKAREIIKEYFNVWLDEWGLSDSIPKKIKSDYVAEIFYETDWSKEDTKRFWDREIEDLKLNYEKTSGD